MEGARKPSQALVAPEARMRRARRRIIAISTAVGVATISVVGAVRNPAYLPPAPAGVWLTVGMFGALVANVIVTRIALRRTRRPRCEVCGELVQVTPAWRATRTEACPNCGRTTMAAGRP
jgi:hypothetical protein